MDQELPEPTAIRRRGAVAVVVRDRRFLVIHRSDNVLAPGALCFPGGGIESGESEQQALEREMLEELNVAIQPVRCVWRYVTRWQVDLAWWLGKLDADATISPNPLEVAAFDWMTSDQIVAHPRLLESNRAFFAALASGAICLD